jgi:hypothetical protein
MLRWDDKATLPRAQAGRAALVCLVLGIVLLFFMVDVAHCQDRPKDTAMKATIAGYIAVAAADVWQSAPCLHGTTCREVSPVYKHTNPAGFIAIKAAGVTAVTVTAWKIRKTHPKAAWWLLGATTAAQTAVVIYNARQVPKRP